MWTRIGLLSVLSSLAFACAGGFYKVDDALRKKPATSSEPVPNVGYVTATINLENRNLFTTPLYADERDGDLTHLYVYADFEADVAGPKKIPLYLIDLKEGYISETHGAELISAIPFSEGVRGDKFFKLETRAMKEGDVDKVLAVYGLTNSLAKKVGGMAFGPQVAPIFSVIDDGAKALESFAAKEQQFKAQIAIPKTHAAAEYADIYLILPTDQDANTLPEARQLAKEFLESNAVTVCREGNLARACVDGKRYDKLAYIIVDFRLQEHVTDPALLNEVGAGCEGVTERAVARAETRVEEDGVFSSAQREWERTVTARARTLVSLRAANKEGRNKDAVDALHDWVTAASASALEEPGAAAPSPDTSGAKTSVSTRLADLYTRRLKQLDVCLATERTKIPGVDTVNAVVKFLEGEIDVATAEETELEAMLVKTSAYMPSTQQKSLEFLRETRLFQRAAARFLVVNDALYYRFYKDDVARLRAASAVSASADELSAVLERRVAKPTHCEKCRNEAISAVQDYRSKKPGATAALETERARVLADASAVASSLEVAELKLEIGKGDATTVSKTKTEIVDLTKTLSSETTALPSRKAAAKKLSEKVNDGRKLLNEL